MRAAADAFLIEQLGQAAFDQFVVLAKDGHIAQGANGYSVRYHFVPRYLFADDADIIVRVKPGGARANMVPNCAKDPSLCQFRVDREAALRIARDGGFTASDLKVTATPFVRGSELPLAIAVTSCSANKTMHIDYRTGSVLAFFPEVHCGGVQ